MSNSSVLFVCLGNICRSPMAEAAFRREAFAAGLDVLADSAGTGDWHIGSAPDARAQAETLRHGIDISSYRARQVLREDFERFTHIVALDNSNLRDLKRIAPPSPVSQLSLLLNFVDGREGEDVADPYFGDATGFRETWTEVSLAAQAMVRMLGQIRS